MHHLFRFTTDTVALCGTMVDRAAECDSPRGHLVNVEDLCVVCRVLAVPVEPVRVTR